MRGAYGPAHHACTQRGHATAIQRTVHHKTPHASEPSQSIFSLDREMPTRNMAVLVDMAVLAERMESLEKRMAAMVEECMVLLAEEIADLKRRVFDMEGVLLEQFDDRSDVGSTVSTVARYVSNKPMT